MTDSLAAVVDLARYPLHDRDGPAWAALVENCRGQLSRVACVVRTECAGGKAQLTRLPNGLEITEWHPVREAASGKWRFPSMLGTQFVRDAAFVYNFVLAPGAASVRVDGVECATLGHGLEGPVIGHPYWGTEAVINDLRRQPGWAAGRVVMPARRASEAKGHLGAFEL